jgi:hypothetical protein
MDGASSLHLIQQTCLEFVANGKQTVRRDRINPMKTQVLIRESPGKLF